MHPTTIRFQRKDGSVDSFDIRECLTAMQLVEFDELCNEVHAQCGPLTQHDVLDAVMTILKDDLMP